MKGFKEMNIQAYSLSMVLPAVLFITLAGAFFSYQALKRTINGIQIMLFGQFLDKNMAEIEIWLKDQIAIGEITALNGDIIKALNSNSTSAAKSCLETVMKGSDLFENVLLARPDGSVILLEEGEATDAGVNLLKDAVNQTNFEKARSGHSWIGNAAKSQRTGEPTLLITTPVNSQGNFIGLVGLKINMTRFADTYINSHRIGKTGYFYIMDNSGIVFAYYDKTKVLSLNLSEYAFGREMLQKKNGSITFQWGNSDIYSPYITFTSTDWTMGAMINKDEFLAPILKTRAVSYTIAIVTTTLLGLLIWVISAPTIKTILSISDILKDIAEGDGDLTKRVHIEWKNELGVMAGYFNQFLDAQQQMIAKIKQTMSQVMTGANNIRAKILLPEPKNSRLS